MAFSFIPFWKEAPFVRLLIPFIAGIITWFYIRPYPAILWTIFFIAIAGIILFSWSALKVQFKKSWLSGCFLNAILVSTGGLFTQFNDPFVHADILNEFYTDGSLIIVSLLEPLSEKAASWKALADIISIKNEKGSIAPQTKILLYFRKDSTLSPPAYGDIIAFTRSPAKIKNANTTASFDYKTYCALKNIHYQVFLKPDEFIRLRGENTDPLTEFLLTLGNWVLRTLKKYIPGKKECGLAEALLIGYKDDLDKNLVQSYSNTGVVHVIAISGLHLGLIYTLLKFFCFPFKKKRGGKLLAAIVIIAGLWMFSLLAGGSPSVLRSAVMFTSIIIGETIARRSSILNNLAASAFFLLCYDPYWLWDLGFLLSYGALLSIVLFMKPVYHLFITKNKIVDVIWKLNAVTISAQVLTLPLLIYYFKQLPNLFIITNFLTIPLSSIILVGEIILCLLHYFETIATYLGMLLSWLIKLMNSIVEYLDSFVFSSTRGIEINLLQVVLLYVFITFAGIWLVVKINRGLPAALITAILFFVVQALKIWQ